MESCALNFSWGRADYLAMEARRVSVPLVPTRGAGDDVQVAGGLYPLNAFIHIRAHLERQGVGTLNDCLLLTSRGYIPSHAYIIVQRS